MKTLDIEQLHILAEEYGCKEPLSRVYVVKKSLNGKYDDPETCVVEVDREFVSTPQPYHQFYKFCNPMTLTIAEELRTELKQKFLTFAVQQQRQLMHLYDPQGVKTVKPINLSDAYRYISARILLPLSEDEFDQMETGFRLRWNYSTGKMVGDGDFKISVDQYLTSIDSPIDRKKMYRAVELFLEYLEWIGQWGG